MRERTGTASVKTIQLAESTMAPLETHEEGRGSDFGGDEATKLTTDESGLHGERDLACKTESWTGTTKATLSSHPPTAPIHPPRTCPAFFRRGF